jgi:hypothetical protein
MKYFLKHSKKIIYPRIIEKRKYKSIQWDAHVLTPLRGRPVENNIEYS